MASRPALSGLANQGYPMKNFLIVAILMFTTVLVGFNTDASAANVGISLDIGQPGFYGRLHMGGYPPPRLLYRRPVAIWNVPYNRPPIYMRVRPGHARQWRRYCNLYGACNERVYFVHHDWYNREYSPRYQRNNRVQGHFPPPRNDGHDHDNGHGNGNNHDDNHRGNGRR